MQKMNPRWTKWDGFAGPIVDELIEEDWAQQDFVDNTIHNMLCELAEQELEWDISIIQEIFEVVRGLLWERYKIKIAYPAVEIKE
jgi:hypothetical protein